VSLCRLANAVCCAPPISWLLPAPRLWNRREPLRYLQRRLQEGTRFLEGLCSEDELASWRVLDVGCGMGDRAVAVALAGSPAAVGVDTDPEKIIWGRTLELSCGTGRASFVLGTGARLPFPDGSFDLVLLLDVIEHLDQPLAVLADVRRVLVPGGKALVTFPPYLGPWGAHLWKHVRIPWAHLICPETQLLNLWREIHGREVARGRIRTSAARARCIMEADTIPELWSLNEMTIGRFLDLLTAASLEPILVRLHTPGGLAAPLTRLRKIREYLVTRLSAVVERPC
jgi:SAM-dependent methyltransferase